MLDDRVYHLQVDIANALRHWNAAEWIGLTRKVDGAPLPPAEFRAFLEARLAQGHRFAPMVPCPDFDPATGCPGHLVPADPAPAPVDPVTPPPAHPLQERNPACRVPA